MPKKVKSEPVSFRVVSDYNPGQANDAQSRRIEIKDHYTWLRYSPELVGILTAIADDIVGEGYEVVTESKLLKKKVSTFLRDTTFNQKLYTWIMDILLTGDGFLGKAKVSNSDLATVISDVGRLHKMEVSDSFKSHALSAIMKANPSIFEPKRVFNMKSSGIRIKYNVHGEIEGYVQGGTYASETVFQSGTTAVQSSGSADNIPVDGILFSPEEVIHLSLMNLGDSVYGFTPVSSMLNDIASLWYAKDYAGKYFQDDATPDFMFILKNQTPNSPFYKEFLNGIKDMKGKKRKNMVLTGEVEVQRVNALNKDMEFQALIKVFTDRMLMAWSMPPSRVSNLEGNYKGHMESNEGYYKKISRVQELIEEKLNSELFDEFGDVEIYFNRAYKRDESREADIINKLVGKPVLTVNEGREYLGKRPLDNPEYDVIPQASSGFNPTGSQEPKVNPDSEDEVPPVDEQISNMQKALKELQDIKKSEIKVVNFKFFKDIVEHKGYTFQNANIQYLETPEGFELRFNDGLSEYKTFVEKSKIADLKAFEVEVLTYAIPLLSIEPIRIGLKVTTNGNP
jgi:hypothetical protein